MDKPFKIGQVCSIDIKAKNYDYCKIVDGYYHEKREVWRLLIIYKTVRGIAGHIEKDLENVTL